VWVRLGELRPDFLGMAVCSTRLVPRALRANSGARRCAGRSVDVLSLNHAIPNAELRLFGPRLTYAGGAVYCITNRIRSRGRNGTYLVAAAEKLTLRIFLQDVINN